MVPARQVVLAMVVRRHIVRVLEIEVIFFRLVVFNCLQRIRNALLIENHSLVSLITLLLHLIDNLLRLILSLLVFQIRPSYVQLFLIVDDKILDLRSHQRLILFDGSHINLLFLRHVTQVF